MLKIFKILIKKIKYSFIVNPIWLKKINGKNIETYVFNSKIDNLNEI